MDEDPMGVVSQKIAQAVQQLTVALNMYAQQRMYRVMNKNRQLEEARAARRQGVAGAEAAYPASDEKESIAQNYTNLTNREWLRDSTPGEVIAALEAFNKEIADIELTHASVLEARQEIMEVFRQFGVENQTVEALALEQEKTPNQKLAEQAHQLIQNPPQYAEESEIVRSQINNLVGQMQSNVEEVLAQDPVSQRFIDEQNFYVTTIGDLEAAHLITLDEYEQAAARWEEYNQRFRDALVQKYPDVMRTVDAAENTADYHRQRADEGFSAAASEADPEKAQQLRREAVADDRIADNQYAEADAYKGDAINYEQLSAQTADAYYGSQQHYEDMVAAGQKDGMSPRMARDMAKMRAGFKHNPKKVVVPKSSGKGYGGDAPGISQSRVPNMSL